MLHSLLSCERNVLILPKIASFCSVSKQMVNTPSFMVRRDAERHISLSQNSPYGAGRPGRLARKKQAANGGGDDAEGDF